jgi:GNAT superfamily N-acetyltransferase
MSYLTDEDIVNIQNDVRLLSVGEIGDISHYSFDSHIAEYNDFLHIADKFYDLNVSKTFLLIHKKTNELLAYMTLSADSIKLTFEEKELHDISAVPYASIPALKVGKLAVNKELHEAPKRKGYGSFMLEMARAFAFEMNEIGVACRFITVDADIEYNPDTPVFYEKNGFVENLSNRSRNARHTISMRKDIFVD